MISSRKKFSFLLAFLLLSGFSLTSWLSYHAAYKTLAAEVTEQSLPLTSDNIYSEIQHDLFRPIFISSLMAHDTFVRDWALSENSKPEPLVKYLKEIQTKYQTISSFFIADKDLRYYYPKGILQTLEKDNPEHHWYFNAKNLPPEQDYEINIDNDIADPNNLVVFVNHKVFDYQNNFIGITGVGLSLELVKRLMTTYQQRYKRIVYFVDQHGEVVLNSESFALAKNIQQREPLREHISTLLNKASGAISYKEDGKTIFINTRFVEEFHWYLVVEQRSTPREQELHNTLIGNLFVSAFVTILVLILAHLAFNRYQSRLEQMATTDKLSGLLNRQAFDLIFAKQLNYANAKEQNLSLILIDIDDFKEVNDNFGHLVGDTVIQDVAKACKLHLRENDLLCRWGGEEFIILLPNSDSMVAEKIAKRIQHYLSQQNNQHAVTASIGIAQRQGNESTDSLLLRADKALYQAKNTGKNKIIIR